MPRVCVIGGGPAGKEAAAEAARNGAEVTLLERSPQIGLGPTRTAEEADALHEVGDLLPTRTEGRVEVVSGREAITVDKDLTVHTSRGPAKFDGVVLATGTRPMVPYFVGWRKPGVLVVDFPHRFVEERESLRSAVMSVVFGAGLDTLRVAAELAGEGRKVTLLCPGLVIDRNLSPILNQILKEGAAEAGIGILDASLERAVGLGSVEAVVAGGSVIPCEALTVVPDRTPNLPFVDLKVGTLHGVVVDSNLVSSAKGCYAAGGCAEFAFPGTIRTTLLGRSAKASGRVAGANASGRKLSLRPVATFAAVVLGLGIMGSGMSLREARSLGMDVVETSIRAGTRSACSIVHLRRDGRVVGIQLAGKADDSALAFLSLIVVQSLDLGAVASADLDGSTDISLVAETARKGLSRSKIVVGQSPRL